MAEYVTKSGARVEANQFFMYSPCQGVTKYCSNYIVKSPIGLQMVRNLDYVIRIPSGGFFAMPKEVFEFLMESANG